MSISQSNPEQSNLIFKNMLDETMERYFEQVNTPTQSDFLSISSLIVDMDTKVDNLEELIEDTKSNQVPQAEFTYKISNIKSDIRTLDQKLNSILTLLLSEKYSTKIDKVTRNN